MRTRFESGGRKDPVGPTEPVQCLLQVPGFHVDHAHRAAVVAADPHLAAIRRDADRLGLSGSLERARVFALGEGELGDGVVADVARVDPLPARDEGEHVGPGRFGGHRADDLAVFDADDHDASGVPRR